MLTTKIEELDLSKLDVRAQKAISTAKIANVFELIILVKMKNSHILFRNFGVKSKENIKETLKKYGIDVDSIPYDLKDYNIGKGTIERITQICHKYRYPDPNICDLYFLYLQYSEIMHINKSRMPFLKYPLEKQYQDKNKEKFMEDYALIQDALRMVIKQIEKGNFKKEDLEEKLEEALEENQTLTNEVKTKSELLQMLKDLFEENERLKEENARLTSALEEFISKSKAK